MAKSVKKLLCVVLSALMVVGIFANIPMYEAKAAATTTVWVVGDSTVCGFSDNYYYPRYGWGTQLATYLDSSVTINNLALSGRSSLSFTKEAQYSTLLAGMSSGDVLLVGFGHNDEKAEADRYTNPNGDYTTAGSFANCLYENYIVPAREKGVTVVLCTPIVRRTKTGEWSDNDLHITSDSGTYAGGDYAQAIRDLGKTVNVPVIDMTAYTKELYTELGPENTVYLHAWTSSKEGSVDNTHTNIYGAKNNAYYITRQLKELAIEGVAEHVLDASAPTKENDLVQNPNYVEKEYNGVTKDSEIWEKAGIWSPTAFGDIGGASAISTSYQSFSYDAESGSYHIVASGNKGKISSSTDAFAMYYYKVPVGSNFVFSANVTVNSFTSNDQVSFGLIARDDMYIDEYINTTMGDYVAAAPLKLTKAGSAWSCFARKSGTLTQGTTVASAVEAGKTYAVKIESNTDGYACTFGDAPTVSGGFDFQLTAVDSEYVYVGMFATRAADVTFTDVKLLIDGVEAGSEVGEADADYTAVDAALETVPEDLSIYTEATVKALNAAIEAVVRDKKASQQAEVDAMAKAIEDAVAALKIAKNGIYSADDGEFYYYVNDEIDTTKTGLVQNADAWWYVNEGRVEKDYTGFYENENGKWYVVTGKIDVTFKGLALQDGKWLCVVNGKYYPDYTGLILNGGSWWYVNNGELDLTYSGKVSNDGGDWLVKNGKLDLGFTGLRSDGTDFWYIINGRIVSTYTGIYYYSDAYWYINQGRLDMEFKGNVDYNNHTWYVENGKIKSLVE
ncbi:MAG: GDSL-type esterase/lipase family protein [Lachnospiraceae bacterium]